MTKLSLGLAASTALAALLVYGCSGDDPKSKPDATPVEPDTGVTRETGGPRFDDDAGPLCAPVEVNDFSPAWRAPAKFDAARCSGTQVEALISCNFDETADETACKELVENPDNDDCMKCLFTAPTAKALGPILISGNVARLNLAGCVANFEGNTTESSCGAKYQAATECGQEACSSCTDDGAQALEEKNACVQKALETVCESFATAGNCIDALLASGAAAEKCVQGNDFPARATALGKLFCAST